MFDEELMDLSKLNKLSPKKGRVILSEPFMPDEFFKHSAIYLCEHNKEGSFGFILNNILDTSLNELVEELKNNDFTVGFGGPVSSDNLFYIHNLGDKIEDSHLIVPGLWTGGNFDQIISFINDGLITNKQIRFFLGYTGWSEGQLKSEMESYSWIVTKFDQKDVLEIKKDLWSSILKKMGGKYKVISNFPADPSQN